MGTKGFFAGVLADVEHAVSTCFTPGATITAKGVKRVLGVPSGDKSRTVFIARALQDMARRGGLEAAPAKGPRRYKVASGF